MMNAMMRETLLTGTARKAELPGWEAAGKTGTSQEFRDAWFVGYTGSLVAGVWLGNDDGTPTKKVSGGNLPVEVWSRFMKTALAGTPPIPLPGGQWKLLSPAPAGDPNFEPAPPMASLQPQGTGQLGDAIYSGTNAAQPVVPPAAQASQTVALPPARPGAGGTGPLVIAPGMAPPQAGAPQGQAPAPPPGLPRRTVSAEDAPRPPGLVSGGAGAPPRQAAPPPRPQQPGLLDRLFGG